MTSDSRIAVFGDPGLSTRLQTVLTEQGLTCLSLGELEVRDEFQVRQWFREHQPTHVFVCVGVRGGASISDFMFTLVGSINVLNAALGIAERVRLLSVFPTPEYDRLRRLCELIYFEKRQDYGDIVPRTREPATNFAKRAVLEMLNVSSEKAHASRTQGQQQGREVCDEVLPEQAGHQQHGPHSAPLLEVPVKDSQGATSRDIRAQRHAPEGQETAHSVLDHARSVSSMVGAATLPGQ